MICERAGCNKRRHERAKYCGSACRKQAFQAAHNYIGVPLGSSDIAEGKLFEGVVDPGPGKPTAAVRKIKGAKAYRKDRTPVAGTKCSHFVPAGSRCLQKGCYGK